MAPAQRKNQGSAGTRDVVELKGPPCFAVGAKVRAQLAVRNDGTFPGQPVGAILVEAGDEGYVAGIGRFLERYYIYDVDFVARGYRVGMRAAELALLKEAPGDDGP
ncbi:MAG: nitrogen fixation protein NifZ [Gammaproteobacteria bacterium]|nr:nitrogen fixation protein NifZ [Gammaproteobacteria bacterium]